MMASATCASVLPSNGPGKAKRKSYAREFKLTVVNYYRVNNLYQTSKRFSLNTKPILRWVIDDGKLKEAKKGSKRAVTARKAAFSEVEAELYQEYKSLRKRGLASGLRPGEDSYSRRWTQKHPFIFPTGGSMVLSSDIGSASGVPRMCVKDQPVTRRVR